MAAIPFRSSVLEDDPCGVTIATDHAACGKCRSPTPPGHRDIDAGAAGIRVRRVSSLIVEIQAAVASVATDDAVPAKSLRASNPDMGYDPPGATMGLISARRARLTPIKCLRVRTGPKKCSKTTSCVGIGVAQRRIPTGRIRFDSCCYRTQKVNIRVCTALHRACGRKRIFAHNICNTLNCRCFSWIGPPESGHVGNIPVLPERRDFTLDNTFGICVHSVFGA